ncbi:MAG: c-type cytochrome [Pseudomonadota bacterium]
MSQDALSLWERVRVRAIKMVTFLSLCLVLVAGLLTGCAEKEAQKPVTYSPVGVVPADPQRPGDPKAGYSALVNGNYITCGVPYSAYRQVTDKPRPNQLIEGRTGRNQELPYFSTAHVSESGVELVSNNCLLCHAGYIEDKLVIGLGNEFLDFTNDPIINAERMGGYVKGDAEAAEWRRWADRIAAVAPATVTDTIGANPAIHMTLALMAHHDPKTLAWSQQPLIEPPPGSPLPVSVPPWWNMKKKHAMFYNTEGRGDHARILMLAATFCSDTLEEVRRIDAFAPDIHAYLESLEPPAWPYGIDQALGATGREVFEANCSGCHGTYGDDEHYPNLVIAYQEVGTDPELAKASTSKEIERFPVWFNNSFYGEIARAEPAPGYIAPPLDGVWATAPYLHNGSVPTLEVLLNSPQRPKYWRHPAEPNDYDTRTLGWRYTELDYGKDGTEDDKERKLIYDTTRLGASNAGHIFGDGLSDAERVAVLEYLKTL